MGLLERTRHVLRRDLPQVAAEADPAESLRQFILELELTRFDLEEGRRWLTQLSSDLDRRRRDNELKISRHEREIRAALAAESEEVARSRMRDKRELIEIDEALSHQQGSITDQLEEVADGMSELRERIGEAKFLHRQMLEIADEIGAPAHASTRRMATEEEPARKP